MVLLANVFLNTARSVAVGGVTPSASPNLQGVDAFIQPTVQTAYKYLPAGAANSDYAANVNSGVDIVDGDVINSITLRDGVTPWPGLGKVNSNEYFRVTYAQEGTPGPLATKMLYITRVRGGGIVY